MDWMTLLIEIVGAGIFCLWVVIPIREYHSIYRRMRRERSAGTQSSEQPERFE